jgi:DNA-binding GntR family transcriptional regulator
VSRIVRSTLAEQAYSDLRDRIVSGSLPAGHRLVPEELAVTLSISPTPIKEALVRLATDGLVETESRRATVVRRFSREDVGELYAARLLVELHGLDAALATPALARRVAADLAELQAALIAQRTRLTPEGLLEALALDRAFHARIVAAAGNRIMAEWHQRIVMQTHTLRIYSFESYALERLRREHEAIIAALRKADAPRARHALAEHLRLSQDELLARLPEAAP